jgi:hypothetical protein
MYRDIFMVLTVPCLQCVATQCNFKGCASKYLTMDSSPLAPTSNTYITQQDSRSLRTSNLVTAKSQIFAMDYEKQNACKIEPIR